jgi:hypothetical protein
MTDNPTPHHVSPETLARIREYQQAVLEYERFDEEVDALLSASGGRSEDLSDEDFVRYRELQDLRDLAYNQMKALERSLLDES